MRAPKSQELSRDDKIEIRTLRKYNGWDYMTIAKATGKTYRQVQDAITGPLTPQKVSSFYSYKAKLTVR